MTDDQFKYLSSLVLGFLSAQVTKKTAEYWPLIFETWFECWHLDPPTQKEVEAGKTEQDRQNAIKPVSEVLHFKIDSLTIVTPQQIKEWFGNHTCEMLATDGNHKDILDFPTKKRRKLQAFQAYLTLYYKIKIRDVVEERWTEKVLEAEFESDGDVANKKKPLPKVPPLVF